MQAHIHKRKWIDLPHYRQHLQILATGSMQYMLHLHMWVFLFFMSFSSHKQVRKQCDHYHKEKLSYNELAGYPSENCTKLWPYPMTSYDCIILYLYLTNNVSYHLIYLEFLTHTRNMLPVQEVEGPGLKCWVAQTCAATFCVCFFASARCLNLQLPGCDYDHRNTLKYC